MCDAIQCLQKGSNSTVASWECKDRSETVVWLGRAHHFTLQNFVCRFTLHQTLPLCWVWILMKRPWTIVESLSLEVFIESFRLEKNYKIMKSKHWPDLLSPITKSCSLVLWKQIGQNSKLSLNFMLNLLEVGGWKRDFPRSLLIWLILWLYDSCRIN